MEEDDPRIKRDKLIESNMCPDCNGKLRTTSDEVYCTHCGLVIDDDIVDPGIDWTGEEMDEKGSEKSRAGKPGSFADGDIYHTGMTEITKQDARKCDK